MRRLLSLVLLLAFLSLCSDAAPDRETIRKAIDRGAKYLKDPNLAKTYLNSRVGYVAVIGLALLESDVPPSDPTLEQITALVRRECMTKNETYDVALSLMYLDRLGEPEDVPVIQYLGVRLMAGMTSTGLWSYSWGPQLSPEEGQRLRGVLTGGTELKSREPAKKEKGGQEGESGKKAVPKKITPVSIGPDGKEVGDAKAKDGKSKEDKPREEREPERTRLHPEVKRMIDRIEQERRTNPMGGPVGGLADAGIGGDMSNTQFALIGLWCSRKHGVPADAVLLRVEEASRVSQAADGGWSYGRLGDASSPAMTCPGLISLAMGFGVKKPAKGKEKEFDPNNDPWMRRGLIRLGQYLLGENPQIKGGQFLGGGEVLNQNYYFMWSLERTGVIYGIDTMNNVDWFAWGSEILLKNQQANGSWTGGNYHGASADLDTAFALLFLNRANLAKDLTANLKGRVKDPGSTTLKGGKDLASMLPELGKTPPSEGPPRKNAAPKIDDIRPVTTPSLLPTDDAYETQARELTEAVASAPASERKELLSKLRDTKGAVYTDALGRVARRLEGDAQKEAREALALRLTRMTANTLREQLKDDNREIRRAAAVACAAKEDRSLVADLIESLHDREQIVSRAAHDSLKAITGKDFGPELNAAPADVVKAAAAWKAWWVTQK